VTDLVALNRSDLKKKVPEDWECWILSYAGEVASPSETEFCYIVIVPHLEDSCLQPCWDTAGASIQVASRCYIFTLVQWERSNSRGCWSSILCRPHQRPNLKFQLRVSWCGKSLSSAIRQIPALKGIDPDSLQRKLRVNEYVNEGSNRKNISIKPEIFL
jgi:hypothetical protein